MVARGQEGWIKSAKKIQKENTEKKEGKNDKNALAITPSSLLTGWRGEVMLLIGRQGFSLSNLRSDMFGSIFASTCREGDL